MNETLLKAARGLREKVIEHPGKEFSSTQVIGWYRIPRRTALLLLRLLTYVGVFTETKQHGVRVFTSTGRLELPPIADLIKQIRHGADKNELGVLNPAALAAVYGYPEEAAREALATIIPSTGKTSRPTLKPEAATGALPLLEQPDGLRWHPSGWLCSSPKKGDLLITENGAGPFALPADPLDERAAWWLDGWLIDEVGEFDAWTWEQLRSLVRMARERQLEDDSRERIRLPTRESPAPKVDVWVTGMHPPDPSRDKRPNATQWRLVWNGTPDSINHVGRGGQLLLDVDPTAGANKIVLVVFHAHGQPMELIKVDKLLLTPDACARAAWAAHGGELATIVEIVAHAYKVVGWPATHRLA